MQRVSLEIEGNTLFMLPGESRDLIKPIPVRKFRQKNQIKGSINFHIIRILEIITMMPTPINIFFTGSLPARRAAIGAAITPPTIRPKMVCQ